MTAKVAPKRGLLPSVTADPASVPLPAATQARGTGSLPPPALDRDSQGDSAGHLFTPFAQSHSTDSACVLGGSLLRGSRPRAPGRPGDLQFGLGQGSSRPPA